MLSALRIDSDRHYFPLNPIPIIHRSVTPGPAESLVQSNEFAGVLNNTDISGVRR